ncbi:glycosyltransferase [Chryseobacterium camelliae]|uniref:Glycosyltransferase n=1 Tax=Chryseobacterium camelliae TaxID=1265445 RepID=A0ABY7QIV3_9FLAO|nr:glycosyltransferase [Chryseobacterium camelliae]WBV59572.1 glycosyltransferase [Chryseobacterium camelliae]
MKISVAICTYNGEQYLAGQLDSIIQQTVKPAEIVVCDDRSEDKTLEILQSYREQYPDLFKIHSNEANLGYFKNFEKSIYLCSQEIIVTCDQDDIWKPEKLEETLRFFKNNPDKDAVFNDLVLVDNDLTILEPSYLNWKHIQYQDIIDSIKNEELFIKVQIQGSFILGCALAIRKTALEEYHLKNFTFAHDYEIAQKLSFKNKIGFIPETLSLYRQHEAQVCGLREQKIKTSVAEKISAEKKDFNEIIWPYLSSLQTAKKLFPQEDIKKTNLYAKFLKQRNIYLKNLNFLSRKKYILQCVKHQYLDLKFTDIFRY